MVLLTMIIKAQVISTRVLNTTGGYGGAGNVLVDWSIGEISIHTLLQNDFIVTEGLLQPNSSLVVLPVKIVHFTGKLDSNSAILNWKASVELNSDWFFVERSTDAIQFVTVGKVKASGNEKAYDFIDKNIPPKNLFYRLKSTDINGSYDYSKTIVLKNESLAAISIFPNPVASTLYVAIQEKDLVVDIAIVNEQGITVKKFIPLTGSRQFEIELAGIKAGIYFVQIRMKDRVIVRKIIKT